MQGWKQFCSQLADKIDINALKASAGDYDKYGVYPDSIHSMDNTYFFMAKDGDGKKLVIWSESSLPGTFRGEDMTIGAGTAKVCPMTNANCKALTNIFPFIAPVSHKGRNITMGLGDRLGIASPGHLRHLKDKSVFPVIAQQSIRELNLTGRTYDDVLSAASWAVFQEGYDKGFGADGDHLKTEQELKMALDAGFTMITLDCSEHIDNSITSMSQDEIAALYLEIPREISEKLESKYMGIDITLNGGTKLSFEQNEYKKIVLIYLKAVQFTIDIYHKVIKNCGRDIDFEMSIDETLTSTTPESHYFVARELIDRGVDITSLAPRFCGEFQKGIDYIGDINKFDEEFIAHVKIAQHFGYKISVHSGSDKFSVFPIIGERTEGKYHLKTAGTNWLEAVRVIAIKAPALYRRMHIFALENLDKAKNYYHIGAVPQRIPDIDGMDDSSLPSLMDMDDARQVLHITYGLILTDKDDKGNYIFKDEIYRILEDCEDEYYKALQKHIGRHIAQLKV